VEDAGLKEKRLILHFLVFRETSSAGAIGPNLAAAEEESQLTSPWSRSSCPAEEDASLLPPARYGERGQMPCGHLSLSRMDALKQVAFCELCS